MTRSCSAPTMRARYRRPPHEACEAAPCRDATLPRLLKHRALAERHGADFFEKAGEGVLEAVVAGRRPTLLSLVRRGSDRPRSNCEGAVGVPDRYGSLLEAGGFVSAGWSDQTIV